jgi:hypothetical protein
MSRSVAGDEEVGEVQKRAQEIGTGSDTLLTAGVTVLKQTIALALDGDRLPCRH